MYTMASKKNAVSHRSSASASQNMLISGLCEKQQLELENLTLTTQPVKTFKLFILAIIQYLKRSVLYLLAHGGWFMLLSTVVAVVGILLITLDGPHGKHVEELLHYLQFGLWWVALGVASSIGLGSGLHTFVLYLGPHIALFTIKAMQCGRVDLKSAPYDTIQWQRGPSWLEKDCSEFGPSLFSSLHGSRVPLSSILPQVQMEAVLWGIGTALGELPPYFISRAASTSGSKVNAMEELDASSTKDNGVLATHLIQIKRWFLSHSQYLNFFTILVLASVPNPLFDLAGIMCGQFGIPFWEFFLATVIGKAIIKTHIQTVFIISVCNNQLLHWIENELIWVLSHIPGFASVMPNVVSKLQTMRDKYLATSSSVPSNIKGSAHSSKLRLVLGSRHGSSLSTYGGKVSRLLLSQSLQLSGGIVHWVKKWNLSFTTFWNAVVWLMIINFFSKIVSTTAQRYLKRQQDKDMAVLKNQLASSGSSNGYDDNLPSDELEK